MNIVSNGMLIVSGVYLALGLIYLRFWWGERARTAYLAFSICCLLYSFFAWFELGMMKASTPDRYLFFAYWDFFPGNCALVAMAYFAYLRLHGRRGLFVAYVASRILAVGIHIVMPNGINFREINDIGQSVIFGETLSYPIAVPNPWMIIPHLSHVLMIVFFLDASIRCWRRGARRLALTFGTGTLLFGSTILIFAISVLWGLAPIPIASSFAALFIVAAMLYELNHDMHTAALLSEKLEERETRLIETLEQLRLSAAAGNVGMWTRSIHGEIIWSSEKAAEIWGFHGDAQFTQEDLIHKVHPGDIGRVMTCLREIASGKERYQIDFRIVAGDGSVRWVSSQGETDTLEDTPIVRGAIVDITKLKLAEEAVRDLTTRLMNAQEKERARLARELHDGLNQSVALLSIQIGMLRNDPRDIGYVKQQLDHLASSLERLSEDVHRISYELHPANLNRLGLEAAISTLCHDLSAINELEIDFQAKEVPRDLPRDVSLCLYRVAQESLHNVIRHSHATSAHVSVSFERDHVRLVIADNGKGFDPDNAEKRRGLGLLSINERVERLNGRTEIQSRAGEGTRIEVLIPLQEQVLEYFPIRASSTAEV